MPNYNLKKGINIFYGKLFILHGIVYCKSFNKFVEIISTMCNMYTFTKYNAYYKEYIPDNDFLYFEINYWKFLKRDLSLFLSLNGHEQLQLITV